VFDFRNGSVADILGFCNIDYLEQGNIGMNDITIGLDLAEEDILAYEVPDEAVESAAVLLRDRAGSVTVSFCSGLDSCPS
jgi:hypothetical protein